MTGLDWGTPDGESPRLPAGDMHPRLAFQASGGEVSLWLPGEWTVPEPRSQRWYGIEGLGLALLMESMGMWRPARQPSLRWIDFCQLPPVTAFGLTDGPVQIPSGIPADRRSVSVTLAGGWRLSGEDEDRSLFTVSTGPSKADTYRFAACWDEDHDWGWYLQPLDS